MDVPMRNEIEKMIEKIGEELLERLGDKITLDAVHALIQQGVTAKTIKCIQRGTVSLETSVTIPLSGFEDTGKMVVLLDGTTGSFEADGTATLPYIAALTTDALTLASKGRGNSNGNHGWTFSYQVIGCY